MKTFESISDQYDEQCAELDEYYERRLINACTAIEVVRVNDWYSVQKKKILNQWLTQMQEVADQQVLAKVH